jgi:Uma2 family endonuclease
MGFMALTTATPVSEDLYREIALGDPRLELHHGQLREKLSMSVEHNNIADLLATSLRNQLDRGEYRVRENLGRLRHSADTYFIPDVVVIPAGMVQALSARPGSLDAYTDPMPLVVEIWSPSTGAYDIREKIAAYQQRGDHEIWFIHPYQRTLTAWVRQADGAYLQEIASGGIVQPSSLPGVTIDLDALFTPWAAT